ncbi:MAP3K12-binding inhibitory protein 1 isoform X2 [Sminthopsis crassicaudata]|uniref:MAP3K12-binding inhibitory protein 1 isoform X2 n=1 Tax=Sminthopsis crassicaudata TaxID=9301 RepID=UPI003D693806
MASPVGDAGHPRGTDKNLDQSCNFYREVLVGFLHSLRTLTGQLNLGDDVVKITIDWNKLQSLSALQPALLFSALEQHVLYFQPFLERLQRLIKEEIINAIEEADKTKLVNKNDSKTFPDDNLHADEKYEDCGLGVLKDKQINFDPEVVQIKAGKAEIDRRISAFIERKQAEINENNVREFCNVIDCNQGFKSHVKVSRVVNTYGPQTRTEETQGTGHKINNMFRDCGNQAVEERLQNIEAHLRLHAGGPVPKDIYQRIKKLEDKILELEGISPEYFQPVNYSGKRRKVQPPQQNYSLAELDEKISALKQALLRKSNETESKVIDQLP